MYWQYGLRGDRPIAQQKSSEGLSLRLTERLQ
jgi:hypothetical protein